MTLAPFAAKLIGKQTLQLYIADGKYRMQVFALEDLQDGVFTIYCPDAVDEAMKLGLLREARPEGDQYVIEPSKRSCCSSSSTRTRSTRQHITRT